ncbi:hypothetical protein NKG94_30420 [Micromonospora sp. M12]
MPDSTLSTLADVVLIGRDGKPSSAATGRSATHGSVEVISHRRHRCVKEYGDPPHPQPPPDRRTPSSRIRSRRPLGSRRHHSRRSPAPRTRRLVGAQLPTAATGCPVAGAIRSSPHHRRRRPVPRGPSWPWLSARPSSPCSAPPVPSWRSSSAPPGPRAVDHRRFPVDVISGHRRHPQHVSRRHLVVDGDKGTVEITVTKFRSATKPCKSHGTKPDEGLYVIADVTVAVTKGTASTNPLAFHWVAADGTTSEAVGGPSPAAASRYRRART